MSVLCSKHGDDGGGGMQQPNTSRTNQTGGDRTQATLARVQRALSWIGEVQMHAEQTPTQNFKTAHMCRSVHGWHGKPLFPAKSAPDTARMNVNQTQVAVFVVFVLFTGFLYTLCGCCCMYSIYVVFVRSRQFTSRPMMQAACPPTNNACTKSRIWCERATRVHVP